MSRVPSGLNPSTGGPNPRPAPARSGRAFQSSPEPSHERPQSHEDSQDDTHRRHDEEDPSPLDPPQGARPVPSSPWPRAGRLRRQAFGFR